MNKTLAFGLILAVLSSGADSPPKYKLGTYSGKVVTLTEALAPLKLAYDKEPVASQVVLVGDDGAITPLLSDDASRALFRDPRVRNCKAELQARKYPGLAYLQVVSFKIEDDGRFRTPEYYCEICSISVRWDQDCPCCQGPLIFRMKPDEH